MIKFLIKLKYQIQYAFINRRMSSSLNNQSANRNDEYDNRSDIWSVEVLASDSEQNTVDNQADYRLHDLENEANVNSVSCLHIGLLMQ